MKGRCGSSDSDPVFIGMREDEPATFFRAVCLVLPMEPYADEESPNEERTRKDMGEIKSNARKDGGAT